MLYLDFHGLSHFWDKIVEWLSGPSSGLVHSTGNETISGRKTFHGIIAGGSSTTNAIFAAADEGSAMASNLYGGLLYDDGATVTAYGKNHQYNPGRALLRPALSAEVHKSFAASPDGTLTWDGQPLQTSSDGRLKTEPEAVPDAVLDAWEAVEWRRFKYLDAVVRKGDGARFHAGLVAQQVRDVFAARGLDACEYGILCYDGEADLWTVRYAEACAMEAACQRRRLDRLEALLSRSGSEG